MKTILAQLFRAWLAANEAGWNGACTAVAAYVSAAVGAAIVPSFSPLTLKQGVTVFVVSFAWHFFGYFEKNPLKIEDETPRFRASAVNYHEPKP